MWVDVADDLAAVALLGGEGPDDARALGRAVERLRDRTAKASFVRRLGLSRMVADARVTVVGDEVRVVVVIGPRRLAQMIAEMLRRLRAPVEGAS